MDETTGDASATADVTDTATIQTGSEDENRYSQNSPVHLVQDLESLHLILSL